MVGQTGIVKILNLENQVIHTILTVIHSFSTGLYSCSQVIHNPPRGYPHRLTTVLPPSINMYTHTHTHTQCTRQRSGAFLAIVNTVPQQPCQVISSQRGLCVNTVIMRVCITCASDSEIYRAIVARCSQFSINIDIQAHLLVDTQYWIASFHSEPSPQLTCLLLQYSDHLTVY